MMNDSQPQGSPVGGPDPDFQRRAAIHAMRQQCGLLALSVIVSVLVIYLMQAFGSWLIVRVLWDRPLPISLDAIQQILTILLYLLAFVLPCLGYARLIGFPLRVIPHDPPYPPVLAATTGVALGVAVVGIFASVVCSVFFSMFGLLPADLSFALPPDPLAAVLTAFNMTVLPAVVEEFTQRGIILGSLRRFGDGFAIIVSAVIFALLHRNMVQIPNALLLGLTLGYFMVKTNSIFVSIVIHFINNLLVLVFYLLTMHLPDLQILIWEGFLFLCYLAAAGAGLYYLLGVRRVRLPLARGSCPAGTGRLLGKFFTHFPVVMMLFLFFWVTFLNFTR